MDECLPKRVNEGAPSEGVLSRVDGYWLNGEVGTGRNGRKLKARELVA